MGAYPKSILKVTYETSRPVARFILDAPPLNIITMDTREHLSAAFDEASLSKDVSVVVLEGGGGEAFSSGGDIGAFLDCTPEYLSHLAHHVAAPERCTKPVIARLSGYTFGVGLEIALACDFRIASENVKLALPEMKLGMIPGSGGTQRVARMAGLGRAKDMIFRARRIGAEEARSWGLLTEVVPAGELDGAVDGLIDELLAFSPLALAAAKETLEASMQGPLPLGLKIEGQAYGRLSASDDFREGVRAFKEKRKPHFKGS